jgi:hypothetical protein
MYGYLYLGLGSVMALSALALSALALSVEAPHRPAVSILRGHAPGGLAGGCSDGAPAKNSRFLIHRDWTIRSYMLTWTFVVCRIAYNYDFFPALGAESATPASWVNWIVPFVICEILLQWSAGVSPLHWAMRALSASHPFGHSHCSLAA